ncbi:hypothetical protein OAH18_00580 [bacterium]|nr:hypothetical protein [bacterium]
MDHCITTQKRGVVRVTGHVLYQTLRWMDDDGKPVTTDIPASFDAIVNHAGVSRGSVRPSLDISMSEHFIECAQLPSRNRAGSTGRVGEYRIVWADQVTDVFAGFYAGEGRRTPVPHAFFTEVIPVEALAVIRVVAAVIRHTAGYTSQFGGRRKTATLSYSALQAYTGLSRQSLADAIKAAISKGYIVADERGVFSPDQTEQVASTYRLKWLQKDRSSLKGSKSRPEEIVQKVDQKERFKKLTSVSSKSRPAERFKKLTSNKETEKETSKQQHVVAENQNSFTMLIDIGFEKKIAQHLSVMRSEEEIQNQIKWMPMRSVNSNALGLLRKAIEENWSKPKVTARNGTHHRRTEKHEPLADNGGGELRHQRQESRNVRLAQWHSLSQKEQQQWHRIAIREAATQIEKRRLLSHTNLNDPPNKTLATMAKNLKLPIGESS